MTKSLFFWRVTKTLTLTDVVINVVMEDLVVWIGIIAGILVTSSYIP